MTSRDTQLIKWRRFNTTAQIMKMMHPSINTYVVLWHPFVTAIAYTITSLATQDEISDSFNTLRYEEVGGRLKTLCNIIILYMQYTWLGD